MKAPKFRYVRVESLDQALVLLDKHGEDVRILAGGQSLIPTMNFRLAQPAVLLDLKSSPSVTNIDGHVVSIPFTICLTPSSITLRERVHS